MLTYNECTTYIYILSYSVFCTLIYRSYKDLMHTNLKICLNVNQMVASLACLFGLGEGAFCFILHQTKQTNIIKTVCKIYLRMFLCVDHSQWNLLLYSLLFAFIFHHYLLYSWSRLEQNLKRFCVRIKGLQSLEKKKPNNLRL